MSRSFSAGTGEEPVEDQGIVIPVPGNINTPERIAEYLRRIANRYDRPTTLDPQVFQLATLGARRFDFTNTDVNAFLLTVEFGVVFFYFGDYTSQNGLLTTTPHGCISATIVPNTQQFIISPTDRLILTLQATTAGPANGTLTPMYT